MLKNETFVTSTFFKLKFYELLAHNCYCHNFLLPFLLSGGEIIISSCHKAKAGRWEAKL